MIFFKLPALPLVKQPVSRKGKEKVGASEVSGESTKGSALVDLSRGYMGKMLVYKSGATYLKLGETLFQVCPIAVFESSIAIAMLTHPIICPSLSQFTIFIIYYLLN